MNKPQDQADDTARKQRNLHPVVFTASTLIIFALLLTTVAATETVGDFFGQLQSAILERFGWFYVLAMTGFLGFVVWLMLSRYGQVKLGPDDSEPEFSTLTWFAMLFSAGMGIGLLFFSVAEPIMHFRAPPTGEGGNLAAAREAMGLTFFHWGLHPWAVYSVVGVSLAYFSFRRGLPLTIRSAFYPLFGERIHGRIGDAIDTLAVVSTLFGVATSLGLGAIQVNAGLAFVLGIELSTTAQLVIIAVITAVATASVVSGLSVGIRRLSEVNISLATLLLLFVFAVGPTALLCSALVENIGTYLAHLPQYSFRTGAFAEPETRKWLASWTTFYWAWWIAWAPFVGMFIARVSRGRTIRQFTTAVLLAPTLAGFVWLTIFGDTALYEELFGTGGVAKAVSDNLATAVFVLLERYPLASLASTICVICVALFFVTSSDSASLVVDTIASGGAKDPPVAQRVYWAVLEGAVAAILLLTGGMAALQTAAITTALPFSLVIVVMCISLARGLRIYETPR